MSGSGRAFLRRTHEQAQARAHERRWWVLGVLCFSLVVIIVDNSILNVAIPTIVKDLGASNSQLQWIVDAYTLVFAGLLLTAGSLGDRFGRRGALQVGLSIFGVGSLLAGLSDSASMLIAMRALMGIGAAGIMPSTLSILTNVFTAEERPKAIGFWAATAGLGALIGPIAGGFLIERFSWGSVFLVNVPIVVIGLVAGVFIVPSSRDPEVRRLDIPGALLSIAGLAVLLYAIIEAPVKGWGSAATLACFALGAVLLIAFGVRERHTDHPMLDLTFFSNPRFSAASTAMMLVFFAMFGVLFLLTQYFQFVLGYTPLETGIRFIPWAATMMVVSIASARFTGKFGHTVVVGAGLLCLAVALAAFVFVSDTSDYLVSLMPRMVCISVGLGLVMGPLTESIMGSLPRARAGVGSAMNDTTRQTGGALGVAVIGSALASVYGARMSSFLAGKGIPSGARTTMERSVGFALEYARGPGRRVSGLAGAARQAFVHALHSSITISAGAALVATTVVFLWLPARARDHDVAVADLHEAGPADVLAPATNGRTPATGVQREEA